MRDQTCNIHDAPAARRPLAGPGGSILLVLFMLSALPPATFAQSLEAQAVLELIGTVPDAPRRDLSRDHRPPVGPRVAAAPAPQNWAARVDSAARSVLRAQSSAPLPHATLPADSESSAAAQRAHVRAPQHDLPPPLRA